MSATARTATVMGRTTPPTSSSPTSPRHWASMTMTRNDEGSDTYIGVDTNGRAFTGWCTWKDSAPDNWTWHEIPLPKSGGRS